MKRRKSAGNTVSGTIVINAKAVVSRVSGSVCKIIGEEAKELVGHSIKPLLLSEQAKQKQKIEDLLKSKDLLLREIHHRVANSLQLIAAHLFERARQIQLEEARLPIGDAHSRIMALAGVNRLLATNGNNEVEILHYLSILCDGIKASMIEGRPISLVVTGHSNTPLSSESAVSLGLIVTELVINALKHAFEADTKGVITVSFEEQGKKWRLSVADDGVGSTPDVTQGLGSKIIEGLARQLGARIERSSGSSGLVTSIIRE